MTSLPAASRCVTVLSRRRCSADDSSSSISRARKGGVTVGFLAVALDEEILHASLEVGRRQIRDRHDERRLEVHAFGFVLGAPLGVNERGGAIGEFAGRRIVVGGRADGVDVDHPAAAAAQKRFVDAG
jgi:hypothetical protein